MTIKNVYCSGPIFCPEEVAGLTAIAHVLEEAGYGTFLPTRDGLERIVLGLIDTPLNTKLLGIRSKTHRAIFVLDVFQIVKRCDAYVMNMNGRVKAARSSRNDFQPVLIGSEPAMPAAA